ncbi:glycoside hydrolase family 9 protein [Algirhabdus cladophorae]|uniref:glycoside hydrolase family 9 protein n=1 Tax=Algirhabdus cladophorae TaxID=3377108 RepID=UPI003B846E8D
MENTSYAVSFVADDIIQIRFELGNVVDKATQFTVPEGFDLDEASRFAYVDGQVIGRVGRGGDTFTPMDVYEASPLEPLFGLTIYDDGTREAIVDDLAKWSVQINGQAAQISTLSRKANIADSAHVAEYGFAFKTYQHVFIQLEAPMAEGDNLKISFDDPVFEALDANYEPDDVVSEAIHVNLLGYDPDAVSKVAFLSSWNGWEVDLSQEYGGDWVWQDYGGPLDFEIIDDSTGLVAFSGQTELAQAYETPTDFQRNFSLTDVWQMDFSDFDQEGDFHIRVDGVGRSESFEISDDTWAEVFQTSLSGFYHQRSGIELEAKYTDWTRERALHPEDGNITVLETTVAIMDTNEAYDQSLPDQFELLVNNTTGAVIEEGWGGWHDAGDIDRRTQHMEAARKLIELVEMQPDFADVADGSIPETGNGIPDLLDEAIWGLDIFRRMQTDEGGIRGGVEAGEYFSFGFASWHDPVNLYAYAPGAWSSWEYAAAASKLAHTLKNYDADQAQVWLDSAIDAMAWAEDNVPSDIDTDFFAATARNLAAVELYRATGDQAYHDLYKQTSTYRVERDGIDYREWQFEASFVYASMDPAKTDAGIAARTFNALKERGDFLEFAGRDSGFGYTIDPYAGYGWGATAQQANYSSDIFARLHYLTGDEKYQAILEADLQYLLGANPQNMVFLTGLDDVRSPEKILHGEVEALGREAPPGITLYGDYNINDYGWGDYHTIMYDDVWPNYYQSPVNESFNGFQVFVPSTEFTVQQGMADTTFVAGYLAALEYSAEVLDHTGSGQSDAIQGSRWSDQIRGRNGADELDGAAGNDWLEGGRGFDVMRGGKGRDMLHGGNGNDRLYGQQGGDDLRGGKGNDLLYGNSGADLLKGGAGQDSLWGGIGRDSFLFGTGDGRDRIRDFDAEMDTILLDTDLWTGQLSALDVVQTFGQANQSSQKFKLLFDKGEELILYDATDLSLAALAASIEFV